MPMYTSTPIQRQDCTTTENSGLTSMKICTMLNKIDQLDTGIKTLKTEIIQQMEIKLNELKSSLVRMIESTGKNTSYADSVRTQPRQVLPSECHDVSESCAVDEGYGNLSDGSLQGESSQTHLKRVYTPIHEGNIETFVSDSSARQQILERSTPAQPVQVRITKRAGPRRNQRPPPPKLHNRTLIVGDSLLKGVNTRGLINGVTVCAKSGAKIKDIWAELSVYDLSTFENIFICVGGNDSSK